MSENLNNSFHKSPNYRQDWPDNFDFESDEICQSIFKPFIEEQLNKLKELDEKRPDDITYKFYEHSIRVAEDTKQTCLHMELGNIIANNMYWAILIHDIGKTKIAAEKWDTVEKPDDELVKLRRTHTHKGVTLIEEHFKDINHPFKNLIIDIMLHHHEQINAKGTLGIPAARLSLPVRLSAIIDAFDGGSTWRPHYEDDNRDTSAQGVITRMREEKGPDFFDMQLLEYFAQMKLSEHEIEPENLPEETQCNHSPC